MISSSRTSPAERPGFEAGSIESNAKPTSIRRWRLLGVVSLQLLLLGGGSVWGALRVYGFLAEHSLPPLRERPLDIGPLYDYDSVVSDEQLSRVLSRLGLKGKGAETPIPSVDHALRFWTAAAQFDNPAYLSGADLLTLLTDHRQFVKVYGKDTPPLLIEAEQGVRVRTLEGSTTSSHADHTMACLAEIGVPLDFPLVTPEGEATFREVVEQSLRDFSLNQVEYEWSALTYALYLPPANRWVTSEGQVMTFDRLADRIMREELPRGVCFGHHRVHTLVMFLRADDLVQEQGHAPILSDETHERIVTFLKDITALLVEHQHEDGFWNGDWPHAAPESGEPTEDDGDTLSQRIISTGHVMEWWALAPREVHPPLEVLQAAGQWLVQSIDALTDEETQTYSPFLSHAGRALALWRNRLPPDVPLHYAPEAPSTEDAEHSEPIPKPVAIHAVSTHGCCFTAHDSTR